MNIKYLHNILSVILFFSVISMSFLSILYLTQYDVLIRHDLVFSYGRTFLEPEHGRYLATFFNNLFTEIIPEYLNIHPNDFKPLFVSPLKAFLTVIICLFISFSMFIFKKEMLSKTIFSYAYTITFAITFLFIFNNNFFLKSQHEYFAISETTVFFEYPCSLLVFIPFMNLIAYHYANKILPNKFNFTILYILSFLTALSIDPINVPTFAFISFIGLVLLIENRHKLKEHYKIVIPLFGIYFTYILGLIFYFIRPMHHTPEYGEAINMQHYISLYFNQYLKEYANIFLSEHSILLVPVLMLLTLTLFTYKAKDKNLKNTRGGELFIFGIIITFLAFYFLLFFLGIEHGNFWIHYEKWVMLYKVITYFLLLISFGLFVDTSIKNNNLSNIIKIVTCLIVLAIFNKPLITDNIENIKDTVLSRKEMRKNAYIIEKIAINTKDEEIVIPLDSKQYSEIFFLEEDTCSFFQYVKNVHPKTNIKNFKYEENNESKFDLKIFTEDELANLKFQNLLMEKMYRHKKVIYNCY